MTSSEPNETKSFWEHIGELRKKLLIAFGAFVIGAVVAHIFHAEIIAFLLRPAGCQNLIFLSPLEPLLFIIKIDFTVGILIAFPVIIWCLFSYITPALSKRITALLIYFFLASSFLLITGLIYAFSVILPMTLKFLFSINIEGISNQISATSYISFFILQSFIIAIIFQIPIIIIGGIYLDVFKIKTLSSKRKYIYLITIIALAIITPTVDVFSLLIVLVPCLAIFEISLIVGIVMEVFKKRKEKEISLD